MSKRGLEERVAQYVDSDRMRYRIKIGKLLICRIHGNFGVYKTTCDLSKSGKETNCTCPAEYWPCKHSMALAKTYELAPHTFIDIEDIFKEIQLKTKSELLEIIKKMIQRAPEILSIFGIEGFEDNEKEEEEIEF